MSSSNSIKNNKDNETAVKFTEWLADIRRSRNWVTLLLLLDVGLLISLNAAILSDFLTPPANEPKLPEWYTRVFWLVIGLIFMAALIAAHRTVPRQAEASGNSAEHIALNGLRPFGFTDAEVFARLQREVPLRACLATVTDPEFRFGILYGESGCGKTSFLQAGLRPRLLKQNYQCVYVKFTELDPLESIRQALAEKCELPSDQVENLSFPELLAAAVPAGSPSLVLLLDQFEQFFVHCPVKEEREPFVEALAEWYKSLQRTPIKILICLREDFYDRLVELQKAMVYSLGPHQSLRLEKFTPKEAAAIVGVIAETEALPCDENFVQEMAERQLASREDSLISAVDVQILAWMIQGQRSVEERAFDRTAFQKLGGFEGLLELFLSRALQARETEARRQVALKVLLHSRIWSGMCVPVC